LEDGNQTELLFPGDLKLPNLVPFLEHGIPLIKESGNLKRGHYHSLMHGDLNCGNIMLDSHHNIWIIDFEFTTYGHTLKDVTKLEHDLFYEFTNVESEEDLKQAMIIVEYLIKIDDLSHDLPETLDGISSKQIIKAWKTIRFLRNQVVQKIIDIFRNPIQLFVPLLRYALFSMALKNVSQNQKILCLAAACGYAERIQKSVRKELHLFMMPKLGKGEIGITILPGRKDIGRIFDDDVQHLKNQNISLLISLVTYDDFELKTPDGSLKVLSNKFDHNFIHIPVKNQGVPTGWFYQFNMKMIKWNFF
jgi:hypothetical protein